MKDIKDMKDMETLREKELTKRNKRIQNTISLIRKLNCVIVAIAASLTFFNVWSDYNHYAGSQLVMAEVIDVKGASNENISVTYRFKYNNVIFAIFYDMTLGFCIGLTVVFFRLCEMTNCMLPSDVEEAGVKTYTQNEILKIANKLLADNRKNENADDVDKNPYAAGVHDGILDVLTNLKIDSKEKFLN